MARVPSWRWTHTWLGVAACLPLFVTIATGFLYRFGRDVLGFSKPSMQWLMAVHSLSILSLQHLYPLLMAVVAFALVLTSLPLRPFQQLAANPSLLSLRRFLLPDTWTPRTQHRALTLVLAAPLLLSAVTGAVWTVQKHWLGMGKADIGYLMGIHQGSVFGSALLYTAALFLLSCLALTPGLLLVPSLAAAFTPRQPLAKQRS